MFSALRSLHLGGRITEDQTHDAHATYLAFTEGLDAPLMTCDAKLATTGHQANVRLT